MNGLFAAIFYVNNLFYQINKDYDFVRVFEGFIFNLLGDLLFGFLEHDWTDRSS